MKSDVIHKKPVSDVIQETTEICNKTPMQYGNAFSNVYLVKKQLISLYNSQHYLGVSGLCGDESLQSKEISAGSNVQKLSILYNERK